LNPASSAFSTHLNAAQSDGFFRVGVGDVLKQFAGGDLHAEFLVDFAGEALLKCFARLAFAAGKLPKSAEMGFRMALGDQNFTIAENQRGADFDDVRSLHHSMVNCYIG
jgi:hypothetical protein